MDPPLWWKFFKLDFWQFDDLEKVKMLFGFEAGGSLGPSSDNPSVAARGLLRSSGDAALDLFAPVQDHPQFALCRLLFDFF
jgi:hypothetical protein